MFRHPYIIEGATLAARLNIAKLYYTGGNGELIGLIEEVEAMFVTDNDLAERLECAAHVREGQPPGWPAEARELLAKAATRIRSLTAGSRQLQNSLHEAQQRNVELEGALEPFAQEADRISPPGSDYIGDSCETWQVGGYDTTRSKITYGNLRHARATLKSPQAGGEDHE